MKTELEILSELIYSMLKASGGEIIMKPEDLILPSTPPIVVDFYDPEKNEYHIKLEESHGEQVERHE